MGGSGGATARPVVGRQRELATLRAVVARVAGGEPAAVVLTGPPGVGKTRLASETLALAEAAGFAVFTGHAHDLGRDIAYAPLAAAFGAMLRDADEPRRAALVGDLAPLGLLFNGLGLRAPEPLGDPALERARLMDGLCRLVERLVRERPLALLIDDAHLADTATTAFLRYLTTTVTDRPFLLVVTARPTAEQASGGVAARDLIAGWPTEHIEVGPLCDAASAELMQGLLGSRPEPRFADLVAGRCAGRPLFIEAVTRTLTERGQLVEREGAIWLTADDLPLPDAVRDQLRIRLEPVGADERAVLDLVAVSGGDLEHQVLAAAAALPTRRLLDALDRLHRRGLVTSATVPGSATPRYDVVHGLLRDTLRSELSPVAANRANAALVDALTGIDPDDLRIPGYVIDAGPLVDADRALDQLRRGAAHATRVGASEAAARYLTAATGLARSLGRLDLLAGLLADLATAEQRLGNYLQARAAWCETLAQYRAAGEPIGVARAERELGMLDWGSGDLDAARVRFGAADRALGGLEPSAAHAQLLYTRMITASRVGDSAAVAQTARALRELAGHLGSAALSAQAYLAEAVLDYAATDYRAMVETNLRALAAARESGEAPLVMRAYDQLSVAAASQLDLPELRRYSEASLQIVRDLGAPILQGWPRARLAIADLLSGDWDRALRTAADLTAFAIRHGEQRGSVSAAAGYAWALVHLGRLADAQRYLDQARAAARPMLEGDRNIFSFVAVAGASLALARDEPEQAVEWEGRLEDVTGGWMPLVALSVLGEARARCHDVDGARSVGRRIRDVRSCATVAPDALADWVDGLAASQAGDGEESVEALRRAAAGFGNLGLPFHAARAELAAASELAGTDPTAATGLGQSALEVFDRLGAPIQAREARAVLRSLGVVPSRGRGRRPTGGPLSRRELEVARLVARGMSNAEVATALFVSPRTVTTHLDRIYARLGLSSRVALTRYLADSGLLDDEPAAESAGSAENT